MFFFYLILHFWVGVTYTLTCSLANMVFISIQYLIQLYSILIVTAPLTDKFLFLTRSQLVFPIFTHCPQCECMETEQDFCRKITRPGYRITADTYVTNENKIKKNVNRKKKHCGKLLSC